MTQLLNLIQAFNKSDPLVQKTLVDQHSSRMLSIARRYVSDDHSAYDILQESWISIFNHLDQFNVNFGSFESWTSKIVINHSLKWNKKFKNYQEFNTLVIVESTFDENILSKLNTDQLLEWIQELPNGCREVFNLYIIDDFSHKEIGELLKINEGTSRSQLNYAKQLLKLKINSSNLRAKNYG